jgi:NAD(P)-dependent dehydrogenase (short-subunit alcohol dehydrogenase family)
MQVPARTDVQTKVVGESMNSAKPASGQVAVVTGGARGIGSAIARILASMGFTTVITGRTSAALQQTAEAIRQADGLCQPFTCDVTRLADVEACAAHVKNAHGRIDVLVNNAGVGSFKAPLHQLPPDEWDQVINTNLRGVYYCIRAFAPMMIAAESGHIINISSIASKNALPNGAVYAASKWGLNGLSYSVAEELRSHNIRVSVVCPGSTDTDLSPHAGKSKDRMLKPGDVAHIVAMLVTQAPQSFASEIVLRPTLKP